MKLNFDELFKQKAIYLSSKGFFDDDLDVLIKVIEESTVLERLYLRGNNNLTLTDGKLANAIAKNTTLKVLDLHHNKIGPEGIKHLANALKSNNTTLEALELDENNIGDEGAKYIAEMLDVNNSLQTIGLESNNISPEGARYIADMLAVNKTLQIIGLSSNNIGDKGVESIADSLVVNTGLREIWLESNTISDTGAKKLAEALESNHNITLNLNWNNISNHVEKRIYALCKKNGKIVMLKQSISEKEEELESKDTEIAKKDRDIFKKDKQIASLKQVRVAIRGQLQQLESILDPVDLTSEEEESTEPPSKRARTEEDTPKSTLAAQHESIKEAVKVKEENINEYVSFLQSKIDELAFVAEAGGADKDKVAEIKGRLRLNFDEFVSATAMANMS